MSSFSLDLLAVSLLPYDPYDLTPDLYLSAHLAQYTATVLLQLLQMTRHPSAHLLQYAGRMDCWTCLC